MQSRLFIGLFAILGLSLFLAHQHNATRTHLVHVAQFHKQHHRVIYTPHPTPSPIHENVDQWLHTEVVATAYLIVNNQDDLRHGRCPVFNDKTASGSRVQVGSVAVDRGVFPFHTKMVIPGYGVGRADDTGGAIDGHHIDLAFTSCLAARKWGAKHVIIAYNPPG